MKYKISNAYAVINGEEIQVGVALGLSLIHIYLKQ